MQKATDVSAQQLMALRPGLSSIREKLRFASTRQTTLVEDTAYSLLGIFSVAGVPAIYGGGEDALWQLLTHILVGFGDTSILGWTVQSGGYNSCLPAHIAVFSRPATSHLLPPIEDAQIEETVNALHASTLDFDSAKKLYDRLNDLPAPWFAASRTKLPCIAFKLPHLSPPRTNSGRVYRVETLVFGTVEIKTRQDLSRLSSLCLAHPWLDTLLDREHASVQSRTFLEDDVAESFSPDVDDDMDDEDFQDDFAEPCLRNIDDDDDMSDVENKVDSLSLREQYHRLLIWTPRPWTEGHARYGSLPVSDSRLVHCCSRWRRRVDARRCTGGSRRIARSHCATAGEYPLS